MNGFKKPRFEHDCTRCVYLGQHDSFDCWYCPPREHDTIMGGEVVLRYSSEPAEYASFDLNTAYRIMLSNNKDVHETTTYPAMVAALRAVNERELVVVRYSPRETDWTCSKCGCDLNRWSPQHKEGCAEIAF